MNMPNADRLQGLMSSSPPRRAAVVAMYFLVAFSPFSILILLMLLVGGPEQQTRNGVVRVDLLLFTSSVGAILAGAIIGLLLPATRRAWTAVLVGIAALL